MKSISIRSIMHGMLLMIIAIIVVFLLYKITASLIPSYDIYNIKVYHKYKQLLDNNINIPICIEKIDEGIFREGQCLNNIIITNNQQLISVINLLYNTDIEKELYEYNKEQKEKEN